MGITFWIGQHEQHTEGDNYMYRSAIWVRASKLNPEKPKTYYIKLGIPEREKNYLGNTVSFSYSGFEEFVTDTGLRKIFDDIMCWHRGIVPIKDKHLVKMKWAIDHRQMQDEWHREKLRWLYNIMLRAKRLHRQPVIANS